MVDVRGKTCPIPVIETRRALKQSPKGTIVEIIGTHEPSKYEVPMAAEALKMDILSIDEQDGIWKIRIQIPH
ncbi:MAG: sulfurtransferase TusA family protein [Candidatus Hodarchaeales archaeon]